MPMSDPLLAKKVGQLFPDDRAEVLRLLEQYQGPDRVRVQLALLKQAGGDLERLRVGLEMAGRDYRDILGLAEFPRQMAISASELAALDPKARRAMLEADHGEYQSWLEAGSRDDDEP